MAEPGAEAPAERLYDVRFAEVGRRYVGETPVECVGVRVERR